MSRVLVVEDEAHLAKGLRFNLEAEGHSVEVSGDGESALERLVAKHEEFDVVVLDVMLPGKDGFAVVSGFAQGPQLRSGADSHRTRTTGRRLARICSWRRRLSSQTLSAADIFSPAARPAAPQPVARRRKVWRKRPHRQWKRYGRDFWRRRGKFRGRFRSFFLRRQDD